MIFVLLDSGVSVLQCLSLERRLADQQRVEDTTDGPDVDLVTVTSLAKNLRCDVIRGSAQRSLPFTVKFNVRGQPKITDFDLKIKTNVNMSCQLRIFCN